MTYQVYVGIDVSKAKFDVTWLDNNGNKVKNKAHSKTFTNDAKGFAVFHTWLVKQSTNKQAKTCFIVMEATGVYYENLAYELHGKGYTVAVINPAYAKQFAGAIGSHHKTDKQDAYVLAQYAQTRQPDAWQPPPEHVRQLKQLLVRLETLKTDRQREANRLEKLQVTDTDGIVIGSIQRLLTVYDEQIQLIQAKIDEHIDNHPDLKSGYDNLTSIPSMGKVSAPTILSLLLSKDFKDASQCASFVGLTPMQQQSGVFKGRSRISKKGDSKIRAKLYMCALSAITYNPDVKHLYDRLLARGKCKKVALIAAMRKLLQICFGVIKHQSKYKPQVAMS